MAGINFERPAAQVEQISSVADAVIVNVNSLTILPNQTRYIVFDNLTADHFKLFQVPGVSSVPDTSTTGISAISTTVLFNSNVTAFNYSPQISIHSNSNTGKFTNVKGLLLDGRETTTTPNLTDEVAMGLHTVLNRVGTTFQPYQSQNDYLKPLYIAAGEQLTIRVTNTPLDTTGVPVTYSLALMGQFVVNFPGISQNPLLIDNEVITVDSDTVLTNQVDIT